MQRLFQNRKVKKVIAIILLLLMAFSILPLDNSTNSSTIEVKADSNDRRAAWIELSEGKQTTEIDEIQNIDQESLRVLALFLSNYYIPFSTVLSGTSLEYKGSDGDYDTDELTAYQTSMINALKNDLGFDEDAATYIVGLTVQSSLNSCQEIFMKESDFDYLVDSVYNDKSASKHTLFFYGEGDEDGYSFQSKSSYKESPYVTMSTATIDDTSESMISVSYGLLLSSMNAGQNNAVINAQGKSLDVGYLDSVSYYWIDNGVAKEVFSNSDTDIISYLLSNANLDYKNGVGSALFSITDAYAAELDSSVDVGYFAAPLMKLYIDWVGDIVCNIGTGAIVVLPACYNSQSFSYISYGSEDDDTTTTSLDLSRPLNLVNAAGIYQIQQGNIVYESKSVSLQTYNIKGTDSQGNAVTIYTEESLSKKVSYEADGIKNECKKNNRYKVYKLTDIANSSNLTVETLASSLSIFCFNPYDTTYYLTYRPSSRGSNFNEKIGDGYTTDTKSSYLSYSTSQVSLASKTFDSMNKSEMYRAIIYSNCYEELDSSFKATNLPDEFILAFLSGGGNGDYIPTTYIYVKYNSNGTLENWQVIYDIAEHISDGYTCSTTDSTCISVHPATENDTSNASILSTDYGYSLVSGATTSGIYAGSSTFKGGKIYHNYNNANKSEASATLIHNSRSSSAEVNINLLNKSGSIASKIPTGIGTTVVWNLNGDTLQFSPSKGFLVANEGIEVYWQGTDETPKLSCDIDTYDINGYSIKLYTGNQSLLNLKNWRVEIGSSDTKMDKKIGFGNTDGMDTLNNALDSAGIDRSGNDNTARFASLIDWAYSHTSDRNKTDFYETLSEGKQEYTTMDLAPVAVISDVLYYDTLVEVNEDTSLNDYFQRVDLASLISGSGVSDDTNYATSLNAGNLSLSGSTSMEQAITSLNTGGNEKYAKCIFYTYVWEYFNMDSTTYDSTVNLVNSKLCFDNYPQVTGDIDWSWVTDTTNDEIMSFVYYFLHPTKGVGYVATWFKNKISGIFVGWHEDIVGSSDSNSSTGMTRYLGFTGYVTIPTLNDISWVATLLDNYNSIIVYLIIIMCVVMLCYVLVGSLTVQRGILGVIIFAFFAFLPPFAINTVVDATNTVSDTIYGEKFDYWALVQMQQYILELDKTQDAKEQGDMTTYASYIINSYTSASTSDSIGGASETSYSGVKLKWISPKKYNVTANVSSAMDSIDDNGATYLKNILLNSIASSISGESYIDSDSALYLYRDYLDIYRYASCSYNIYTTFNYNNTITNNDDCVIGYRANKTNATNSVVSRWADADSGESDTLGTLTYSSGLYLSDTILANAEGSSSYTSYYCYDTDLEATSSLFATRHGWLWNNAGYSRVTTDGSSSYANTIGSESIIYYNNTTTLATSLLLNYSSAYEEVATNVENFGYSLYDDELTLDFDALKDRTLVWGLDAYNFNYDISNVTGQRTSSEVDKASDNLGYYYYGLYTESPFYFFSFNIQDQLNSAKADSFNGSAYSYNYDNLQGSTGNIKALFLGENQKYFFNLENTAGSGYGEMRDFMNMHDLFYYIIPIIRQGTDIAREFDELYGLYTYDSCPLHFQSDGTFIYGSESGGTKYTTLDEFESVWQSMNDEEKYKFWHDYNVNTIFNEYSAWLDAMLDCNYAKEENIRINGEKFTVYDPLDPTSYFEWDDEEECITAGRYMVFSRSEMAYYGLSWEDLTQVEQKIITIQDNVYEESLDLMNYYTLSDETLIQAYAMIQLFEFNKEFSQTGLFTEDYVLYPQSYELKAFTYDAYLRLILAGSTGEDLMTTADDTTTTDETSTATNTSIYQRILENTSIFFGIVLLIDDFIAVYILPAFKLAFLIIIFLLSIAMIIASAVKLETPIQAFWKSLLAPMLSFAMISIGMAWLISKFMSEGAQGVVQTSELIQLGDPTMTIAVMVVINVVAMVLYWKILKKCWKDFVTYTKAVFSSIGGALAGAVGAVTGAITSGKRGATELKNRHATNKNTRALNKQAKTAEQRGKDNNPKSGKHSLGSAAVGAGVGAGIATGLGAAAAQNESKAEAKARKYDAKAAKLEKKAEKQKNTQDDIIKDLEKKKNKLDPSATNRSKKLDDKIQKAKNKSKRLEDRAANKKNYLNKKSQNVKDSGRFKGGIRNTAMAMGRFGSHINGGQKGVIADATVGRLSSGAHNVKKGAINLGSSAINTVGSGVSTLKSDFKTGKASKSVVYEAPKPPTPPPTPKTPSNKVQGKKARARKKSASRAARRNH